MRPHLQGESPTLLLLVGGLLTAWAAAGLPCLLCVHPPHRHHEPTVKCSSQPLCPPSRQVLGRKVFSRVVATKDSKEESWMEVGGGGGMYQRQVAARVLRWLYAARRPKSPM